MTNSILPAISSAVSLVFACAVLSQYVKRGKPHQLVWALGLLMYAVSTGCEFYIETYGLNPVPYRMWYLFGALLTAAWLGMGTVYLMAGRRTANVIAGILIVASVAAGIRVLTAPIDFSLLPSPGLELSGQALPSNVRLMTPFFNVFGTVALVGGALYSAWLFWRRRVMGHRVLSNVLIAAGAMSTAAGGSLNRLGGFNMLYLLELLGVLLIFAGFLYSGDISSAARKASMQSESYRG